MPTYEYRCKECGEHLEVVQSFKDEALTECPACHGPLRKVFGNIGITFKGSGFYKTDSRAASSAGRKGASAASGDGGSGESASKSESGSKSDSTTKSDSTGGSKSSDTGSSAKAAAG